MILFYKSKDPYGFLSNLYPAEVEVSTPDGKGTKVYKTSEHAYQVAKCKRKSEIEAIEMVPRGVHAAILGHGLFDYMIVQNWNSIKIDRMKEVLKAKFTQHEVLKRKLIETGDELIAEDSCTDSYWGLGPWKSELTEKPVGRVWMKNGKSFRDGANHLGQFLMELRSRLRNNQKFLSNFHPKGEEDHEL